MSNPLVSIIIPTYNRAHLIVETLDSVLAQTYPHWECVVVDDGSSDNTDKLLQAYCDKDSRFKYAQRPDTHKPGGNGARNYGLTLSKGDYIQWFDSDDIMYENYIGLKIEEFKKDSTTDIVFCGFAYFNKIGIQNRENNLSYSGNIIDDLVDEKITFSPLSYIIKKSIIGDLKYDESLKKAQDLDYFFDLFTTNHSIKIKHINKVLFKVRKHTNAISRNFYNDGSQYKSMFQVHYKILNYFVEINHIKGVKKFLCHTIEDLRMLMKNNHHYSVLIHVLRHKHLNIFNKLKLLRVQVLYIITKRGDKHYSYDKLNL